jgi:hypothetical protein
VLSYSTIAPFAIFTGISIGISGHYKLQNVSCSLLGVALL